MQQWKRGGSWFRFYMLRDVVKSGAWGDPGQAYMTLIQMSPVILPPPPYTGDPPRVPGRAVG